MRMLAVLLLLSGCSPAMLDALAGSPGPSENYPSPELGPMPALGGGYVGGSPLRDEQDAGSSLICLYETPRGTVPVTLPKPANCPASLPD
jgi:hypothetical protein